MAQKSLGRDLCPCCRLLSSERHRARHCTLPSARDSRDMSSFAMSASAPAAGSPISITHKNTQPYPARRRAEPRATQLSSGTWPLAYHQCAAVVRSAMSRNDCHCSPSRTSLCTSVSRSPSTFLRYSEQRPARIRKCRILAYPFNSGIQHGYNQNTSRIQKDTICAKMTPE